MASVFCLIFGRFLAVYDLDLAVYDIVFVRLLHRFRAVYDADFRPFVTSFFGRYGIVFRVWTIYTVLLTIFTQIGSC